MEQLISSKIHEICKNRKLCDALLNKLIKTLGSREMRFMEVCGTHTTAFFQTGLVSMLPSNIRHISGPGCPVCVTSDSEVVLFMKLAKMPENIIACFGDLLRIPAPDGRSLKHAMSEGANVQVVYSPLEALDLAEKNCKKEVIFLGAGFETTAPSIAASILAAQKRNLNNFTVLSLHKLVIPALQALAMENAGNFNALLLPGHVATVIGMEPFGFLASRLPAAVAGFEPADMLLGLIELAKMLDAGESGVINSYQRAVNEKGNKKAQELISLVFTAQDIAWRGLGIIPESGLKIRKSFDKFDAMSKFGLEYTDVKPLAGCRCGDVLKGIIAPNMCPLFSKKCTPFSPVGPCMVSTEGSCSAYYKYGSFKNE